MFKRLSISYEKVLEPAINIKPVKDIRTNIEILKKNEIIIKIILSKKWFDRDVEKDALDSDAEEEKHYR